MFEPLRHLVKLEYGHALPSEKRTGFGYPVYGSNGLVGFHEAPLVEGPGVVVGRKGSVGKVLWSETGFWPIDTTYYVEAEGCEMPWLYRVLDWLPLDRLDTSTGVPGLNRNDVYEISVFVPQEAEQSLISRVLDTLDTQIQKTEALIAKLEKVKEGLLHDLLTRGIDENGQLRPSPEQAPELYKDSPLGLIPREWEVVSFLDAVEFPSGQVSPLIEPYASLPLVAPDHIEAGTSRLIRVETAREQGAISGKYIVRPGDVVYSKIRPYLKKAWLAEIDSICSADMYPLSPKLLTSAILLRIVMSENFSTYANAASMRTGIPKINREELAGYTFALPTMQEQVRMENIFQEIERRAEKERETLCKLVSEKNGLMDDLLTGRVRVTPLLEQAQATTPA